MVNCKTKIDKDTKDSNISLRLTTKEKEIIEKNSKKLKLNMTDYIRYCVLIAEPDKLREKLIEVYKNKYSNLLEANNNLCETSGLKKVKIGINTVYYDSATCNEEINLTENIYKLRFDFFINGTLSSSILTNFI